MRETPAPVSVEGWPRPKACRLLEHAVHEEVTAYRKRRDTNTQFIFLDETQLAAALQAGKVNFGENEVQREDVNEIVVLRNAREAFTDGVVLMFVDGRRVTDLNEELLLSEESKVRYVRIHAIRGY